MIKAFDGQPKDFSRCYMHNEHQQKQQRQITLMYNIGYSTLILQLLDGTVQHKKAYRKGDIFLEAGEFREKVKSLTNPFS